jgi:hypothetical protein
MMAAQRALVRMLFDPAFAAEVRRAPDEVLSDVEPALRRQLAALDERALRQDALRRRRTLRTLSEEFKGSTTLALAETGRLAFLDEFFCSAAFHLQAVVERGSMPLAFAAWLGEQPWRRPETPGVVAIETALARARREKRLPPLAEAKGCVAAAPGVILISATRGAMAALQACERYLFEVGLMPAVALCDDAPLLELPPYDAAPLPLVTVPLDSGVTLVEIDAGLAQLLRCLPGPRERVEREAAARGVEPGRLAELIDDEIAVIV